MRDKFEKKYHLESTSQAEIQKSMKQASFTITLCNWQEFSKLFVDYLQKSPSSPFCRVGGIFFRYEYQKDVGNLSCIHLILKVLWDLLTEQEKDFVKDLIKSFTS